MDNRPETSVAQPTVSIIVPVYNSAPYLDAFIRSVDMQDCSGLELIMIDDGSTDDSGRLLDEAAQEREWMTVIHQENSGWAGAPRNRGIELARGEFVFFADPDDEFGTATALSHMVEFARQNSADIVLPRVVAQGGRTYAQWRYKETQIDADLVTAFTTLTPHKLVRRSLIEKHGLRFPEEKVRLEDGIFFAEAYLRASRVSILTGEEFYLLVHHDDGGHLSKQAIDPAGYIGTSVTRICELVEQLAPEDKIAPIIAELVKRKVLLGSRAKKIRVYKDERIRVWMSAQREFVSQFLTSADRWDALPVNDRRLLQYAEGDDLSGIRTYSQFSETRFACARAEVHGSTALFAGEQALPARAEITFVLRNRADDTQELRAAPSATEGAWSVQLELPRSAGSTDSTTIFDLYIAYSDSLGEVVKRVAAHEDMVIDRAAPQRYEPYTTQKGNVSLRVRPAPKFGSKLKKIAASKLWQVLKYAKTSGRHFSAALKAADLYVARLKAQFDSVIIEQANIRYDEVSLGIDMCACHMRKVRVQ